MVLPLFLMAGGAANEYKATLRAEAEAQARLNEAAVTAEHNKNMKKNLNILGGLHKSQNILLLLMQKGLLRQEAYSIVQKCAQDSWNDTKEFEEIIFNNKEIRNYLDEKELKDFAI